LTVEDFGKESQGEMIIEFLQMKHKCVISVQDSAAADMRYCIVIYGFIVPSADSSNILSRNSVMTSYERHS